MIFSDKFIVTIFTGYNIKYCLCTLYSNSSLHSPIFVSTPYVGPGTTHYSKPNNG